MTALELQKDLAEEIEQILGNMLFKDPSGKQEHLKAYAQELPKREQTVSVGNLMPEEADEEDPYPYCIVKIDSGVINVVEGVQQIQTTLIFGIYDDGMESQGHQDIINIIHKITERFTKGPVLRDKYRMDDSTGITWALDDEDRYPYYFGAVEMMWNAFFVGREDKYV